MWSGVANHVHTEQSGHVLHGVLRSCWLLIHRLCVTQALCKTTGTTARDTLGMWELCSLLYPQLLEILWICESSTGFCTHNCQRCSGYVRALLSFIPTAAGDTLGMWELHCLLYPQLPEIFWVCESSTVFCTHNCQRYSGYVRAPPSLVPRGNRE